MRRTLAGVVALGVLAGVAGSGGGAGREAFAQAAPKPAAPAKKAGAPAAKKKVVVISEAQLPEGTLERLRSGDPAQVKGALDDVRMAGKAAQGAAPVVSELLLRGLSAELTLAAIDTLGDVEAESSSEQVAWYAVHRSKPIRQAAVKALARTKGPDAERALRHALSDEDAVVRGLAATGLGALKARDAVRDLFTALDHRVGEASASIGQLCTPAECDELSNHLGKLPFDIVTGGVDQVLFRPPTEIDDDQKVKLVGRVRELGTPEANRFLKDVQTRWPKTWSPRVKQAIDQGVLATSGGVSQ